MADWVAAASRQTALGEPQTPPHLAHRTFDPECNGPEAYLPANFVSFILGKNL